MSRERIPKSELLEDLMNVMAVKRELYLDNGDEKYKSELDVITQKIQIIIDDEMEDYYPKLTMTTKKQVTA